MFEPEDTRQGNYPANEEEGKQLVANVINMIHSEQITNSLVETLKQGQQNPIETIGQLGAMLTLKVVSGIEKETQRDIPPETELGILSMSIEELFTIASNFGLQADEEMVRNAVQVGSGIFNKMQSQQGKPQAMRGGPQGPQGAQRPQGPQGPPQGPPQGMLQGGA